MKTCHTNLLHEHCVHGLLVLDRVLLHDVQEGEGGGDLPKDLVSILPNNLVKKGNRILSGLLEI